MATVQRFEDLEVWGLAREQCSVFHTLKRSGAYFDDPDLCRQMNRSSASVMDNISEGFERFSKSDFRHFLVMAKGSNGEFRSQLHRMKDRGLLVREDCEKFAQANERLGKKLYAFIHYLTNTGIKDKSKSQEDIEGIAKEPTMSYLSHTINGFEFPGEFLLQK